jgi:hypothetical protein
MATTRITNLWREDLVEVDPDIRVTRVFGEALVSQTDLRVTRIYLEVLHQKGVPPVPVASLVPVLFTQNV